MSRKVCWLLIAALLVVLVPMPAPAAAQSSGYPLDACRLGAFSTEEDFMMREGEPYDGNPYISDGDVLSSSGDVCARNADLLSAFFAASRAPDLGLDALDILDITDRIVAFSTELDDPEGRFTAGDLLFTPGFVIPNVALVHPFGISYDIGLDAVQFLGDRESILGFVDVLANTSREAFVKNPGLLKDLLARYKIDIWFSIEGTAGRPGATQILDGDLLSAASGTVVASNSALLPATVPAGIPSRGVDFGLDAVATSRVGDMEELLSAVVFSTEILYESDKFSFTDGDVLKYGDGIQATNASLIANFAPAADFLGLDALTAAQPLEEPEPMITLIGNRSVWDIDGGFVSIGSGGTGVYWSGLSSGSPTPPRRPFGWYVPIDGYLSDDIVEFRVAFRDVSDPVPTPGTAPGIQTHWRTWEWYMTPPYCRPTGTFDPDSDGWFNAATYRSLRSGAGGCPNGGLVLAVWDTLNDPNVLDKDGHYVIWLEWRTAPSGPIFREPVDHHVQLDNTRPKINKLELRTPSGTVVQPCGGAPAGTHVLQVFGDFHDDYFLGYRLRVRGGNPPNSAYYPGSATWHQYWDGAPYATNLGELGTTPSGLQYLRDIDMEDLGDSFVECCYVLDLWVSDAAIRHNFNRFYAWPAQPWGWPNKFLTFAAAPAP
ncbi:MAG: hypothetical protein J7M34_04805 [Anaerolineae bacterium]|nr:hypothetical protein [Anaerolineae bacterium]